MALAAADGEAQRGPPANRHPQDRLQANLGDVIITPAKHPNSIYDIFIFI